MYVELSKSDAEPIEKIMILKKPLQEETNFETECLLQEFPVQIWALSSTDIGKNNSAALIKIIIGDNFPLLIFANIF